MATHFKLKLLNGPLQNHELHLPPGPFTIGGQDCDLLLHLEGGGHATLEVSEQNVTLTEGASCWIDGYRRSPGALPIGKAIDLAGVHFLLATAESDFLPGRVSGRKSPWQLPLLIISFILLLVAVSGGLFWFFIPSPAAPATPSPPLSSSALNEEWSQILRTEPGLSAQKSGSGILTVSGRCLDSNKLLPLITRLQSTGLHVQVDAVCNDELLRSVQVLLNIYGYPNTVVTLNGSGHAAIDGLFTGDTTELAGALDKLPGLSGWQFSDRGSEELNELIPHLKSENLLNGLMARRSENSWIFSGQIDTEQQTHLTAFLNTANNEPNRKYPLRFIGTGGNVNPTDYLPAPMAGIGGNTQMLYAQLTNGMNLLPGSPVKQGMRVIDITPLGVSIAGPQALIFIPLHN